MAKVGRKESISKEMALKICKMIRWMPDAKILVDWDNVIAHIKRKTGETFDYRYLSQKVWDDDRKLIAEAFSEAREVQKRMESDTVPKYKTSPRGVLQKRIAELEAKYLALQEELEKERAQKVDILDTFLNTPCDLQKLLDSGRAVHTRRT